MFFPPLLNAPLKHPEDDRALVEFRLRMNFTLDFLENDKFDPSLVAYDEDYQNSVAQSPTFIKHLQQVSDLISQNFDKSTRIIEVGCGKGDFINVLEQNGFTELVGFDTAYEGENKRIKRRYLDDGEQTEAQLVILRHTLEHIPQPYDFLSKLKQINQNRGYIYIEVPCLDWIRTNNAFFDIAYEHVNYFSLNALTALFNNKYLAKGHLFGHQYIFVIAKLEDISEDFEREYNNPANWEYADFKKLFPRFLSFLHEVEKKAQNAPQVFLWGGAGKAGSFLHHCKYLAPELLRKLVFAVDINPKKVGKYLPSSLVRIASKDEFFYRASNLDLLLIANPVYTDEIMEELERRNLSDLEILVL